jgi:hypothetical protein
MRLQLTDTPRLIATNYSAPSWVHFRVISGNCLISTESQTLLSGGGMPLNVADNIVSLKWPSRQIWLESAVGSICEIEVII